MCKKTNPDKIEEIDKIHRCSAIPFPLLIYNHGINEFCGITWKQLCEDYENSYRWEGKNLAEIKDDFGEFVKTDVQEELRKHTGKIAAFLLSGKNTNTNKFECYEIYWKPNYHLQSWNRPRLIISGSGKKCLNNHSKLTPDDWGLLEIDDASNKLERLFAMALNEQKRLKLNLFSDDYDIECITDNNAH